MADAVSAPSKPAADWDEQQYRSALAQLERLDQQICTLRLAIPSIVGPLVLPTNHKAATFAQVKKAAINTRSDLKALRETWTSARSVEIMARAKESEAKNGDLSAARDVSADRWMEEGE